MTYDELRIAKILVVGHKKGDKLYIGNSKDQVMKAIEISEASNPLSDYADELDEGMIVLTSNKRSIAALIPLKSLDQESLALSTNPEFIKIIETAREEFKAGKRLSFGRNEARDFRITVKYRMKLWLSSAG